MLFHFFKKRKKKKIVTKKKKKNNNNKEKKKLKKKKNNITNNIKSLSGNSKINIFFFSINPYLYFYYDLIYTRSLEK